MSASSPAAGKPKPLVITVSARALLDMEADHKIFEEKGKKAYIAHMIKHEDEPLPPGPAMPLVRKLLALNERLPEGTPPISVAILSRNDGDTSRRILKSVAHYQLPIEQAIFTNGGPTSDYIEALDVKLFLSANPKQVMRALESGVAAATVMPRKGAAKVQERADIRIALDGDAVIFSDESEKAYSEGGLEAFHQFEKANEGKPMGAGPFRSFLEALYTLQQALGPEDNSIRTALVTARGVQAHTRAMETLRFWNIRVDEAMFLGGRPKGAFLRAFGADIFFDDSRNNVENALEFVASAHVPHGARNVEGADERNFTGGGQELEQKASAGSGEPPAAPVQGAGAQVIRVDPQRRQRQRRPG
jgi:5'-nucleotidase